MHQSVTLKEWVVTESSACSTQLPLCMKITRGGMSERDVRNVVV